MKLWIGILLILVTAHCSPKKSADPSPSPLMVNPTLPVEREAQSPPRLLVVGDSLSSNTPFGRSLVEDFRQFKKNCAGVPLEFENIASFALPSSSPRHYVARSGENRDWLCRQKTIYRNGTQPDQTGVGFCNKIGNQSPLEKLMADERPTDVIVVLGTNSLAFSNDFIVSKVTDMLDQLPEGARCFWVGPTLVSPKYQSKVKNVEKAIGEAIDSSDVPCQQISTYEDMKNQKQCSSFYVSDGIHHTTCGSQLWAEDVFEKICAAY